MDISVLQELEFTFASKFSWDSNFFLWLELCLKNCVDFVHEFSSTWSSIVVL